MRDGIWNAPALGMHSFPSKEVVLCGHPFKLHGIAVDDAYFDGFSSGRTGHVNLAKAVLGLRQSRDTQEQAKGSRRRSRSRGTTGSWIATPPATGPGSRAASAEAWATMAT